MTINISTAGALVPGRAPTSGGTLRIRIVSACYVDGSIQAPGTVLSVPDVQGRELVWTRKAIVETTEQVSAEPENAAPRRRRAKTR